MNQTSNTPSTPLPEQGGDNPQVCDCIFGDGACEEHEDKEAQSNGEDLEQATANFWKERYQMERNKVKLLQESRKQHELDAKEELLDLAYDVIISYGYMRDSGIYTTGGFSTQELAFRIMRKYGFLEKNGNFDANKFAKRYEQS